MLQRSIAVGVVMAVFRALRLNQPPKPYEPKPRFAHYACAVGGQCFVLAGLTVDFDKSKEELSSTVEVFDQYLEEWKALNTTGNPPKGLYVGGCCVSPSGDLYTYGGDDGSNWRGGLYKLSSLKWIQLSAEFDPNGPMRKSGCGMVFFNKSKLAIIGGYGLPHGPPQPGASFVKDKRYTNGNRWTNEIQIFDTLECNWSSPTVSGTRPPPGAFFTLTSIDENRALLYGGRDAEHKCRSSDLYLIDFQTMVITKHQRQEGEPWPIGRSGHAACCLGFGSDQPLLLVTGGFGNDGNTLRDAWIFDISNRRWKEIPVPDGVLPRCNHSTVAIELAPGLIEVTFFGGRPKEDLKKSVNDQPKLAGSVIMTFESVKCSEDGPCVEEWKLVDVAKVDRLGSNDRMKRKIEKIKQFAREAVKGISRQQVSSDEVLTLREAIQTVRSDIEVREREHQEAIQVAVKEKEQEAERAREAAKKAREEDKRARVEAERAREEAKKARDEAERAREEAERTREEAERAREEAERAREEAERARVEAERTREEAEGARVQAERSREEAERAGEEAERQHQVRERELHQQVELVQLEARVSRRRAEEAEAEARALQSHWVVPRREIQLTNEELGRGGWGAVMVANFRGIQVAAKCFYRELTSNYYRDMFSREMNMAARLRHPNLVQFIGASVEGIPVILTELMKTSLRSELEKETIKFQHVTSISLDVAKALNYLHLMQPHPIIHRDISSANVLLDHLPDNGWKAKVSDYGSVNLQEQLQTENPGSPVYSSPEANSPALQSPKMDIFSFGVLLVEMLTGKFPQVSSRQRLIGSIEHAGYLALIEQCLSEERDERPSTHELVAKLKEM